MASESSRSGFGGPAWIIALLATLGIGPALLTPRSQPVPNATSTKAHRAFPPAPASEEVPEHSAAELLENFLDTNPRQINRDKPWSRDDRIAAAGDDYNVRFLIATLPEPDLPPLRSQFDSDLDALSEALNDARYTLASFDLPWLDEAKSDSREFALEQPIDLIAPGADKPSWEIAPPERRRSEHDPGVMLFDHEANSSYPAKQLLVLLVVGESPTRGVNKTALRDALDQIVWLSGKLSGEGSTALRKSTLGRQASRPEPQFSHKRPHEKTLSSKSQIVSPFPVQAHLGGEPDLIKIVGPSFSGSATSLRNTLEEWSGSAPQWRVTIISGAATAIAPADVKPISRPSLVDYRSERIPNSAVIDQVNKLFQPDRSRPPIVILHENTVFGNHHVPDLNGNPKFNVNNPNFVRKVLSLPFPLHISDVRTASGNDTAESASLVSVVGMHDLPLPDEAGQQEEDVVPSFSNRSKVYDQLVLENLLHTIRAARARYVGIVATDSEDLIFLAQQVRANCPDVVLFTASSDLLYTHSRFASDLDGLLVFSTYPLLNQGELWNPFFSTRNVRQFPREDAAGIYIATREQLEGVRSEPQLWLSVVGRETLWPVRLYPPEKRGAPPVSVPRGQQGVSRLPDLKSAFYPLSFRVAVVLLTALCLIPCVVYFVPAGSMSCVLTEASVFPDLEDERVWRIAAFIGTLLITLLVGLGFYLLPAHIFGGTGWADILDLPRKSETPWPVWVIPIIVASLSMVTVLIAALFALSIALHRIFAARFGFPKVGNVLLGAARPYKVRPTAALIALAGTIVGAFLVGYYLKTVWAQSSTEALFAFVRSANLGNRVSPLMPLIFLGISNLGLIGGDLWRLRMLETCRVPLPFLGFDDVESFAGVGKLEQRVIEALERSWWRLPGWWLLVPLLAGLAYIFFANGGLVYPLDGGAFYLLFFVSTGFIYLYFSILLLRFAAVWRALHRLLRRLYWHPSRAAYEELRVSMLPDHSEQKWIRLTESQPTLSAIEYCLESARKILSLSPRHQASHYLVLRITAAQAHLSSALAAHGNHERGEMLLQRFQANRETAVLSSEIVKLVEPLWRLGNQKVPNPDERILREARLFIASRVVDFLRQIFPQLINLAAVAMIGVLAMMLAFSVYPFSNHDTTIWLSWISLLAVVGISLTVFILINRSRVISMLMGNSPGRFSWDSGFSIQLLIYGVVPVLALLGAQFPHVFGGIFSWATGVFGGAKQQ